MTRTRERTNRVPTYREMFKIAMVDGTKLLVQDAKRAVSILAGKHTRDGERCGLRACEGPSVSTFPDPDEWRDRDLEVCRKHWAMIHGSRAVVYSILVAALAALYWMVMTA